MSIELVILFNYLNLWCPLLLPWLFPNIRVFSKVLALHIRWPKCWNFSFSISASNEYSGLISFAAAAAKLLQSCLTLCDSIDSSPAGSAVPGILQERTLKWVASSFSNAWKWKVKVKSLSHVRLLATPWTAAYQAPPSMGFSWFDLAVQGALNNLLQHHSLKASILHHPGFFMVQLSHLYIWLLESRLPGEVFCSVQFSSVTQSCPTLCNPMNCSMPGLPVHHQLPEPTQTHVHWVGNAIQPSHPLSSPSPPALHLSQHQGLFKWVSSSHQMAKVLEFQLQHQSFQWKPRTDLLLDGLVGSPCSPRDCQESSPTPQFKSINSSALSFFYSPTLTSIHNYWKNHSLN